MSEQKNDMASVAGAEGSACGATEAQHSAGLDDLFAGPGMHFPAISLWQPLAQLPLVDAKPWETRSRPYPAKYHGRRVVVCSTKAFTPRALVTPALHDLCVGALGAGYEHALPRGMALYSIVLSGCERTEDMVHRVPPELLASGDFSPGRWAWRWTDPEPFNAFPVVGGQGWFRVTVPNGAFRCATIPAENGAADGGEAVHSSLPPADPLPSSPLPDLLREVVEALRDLVLYHDVPATAQDPVVVPLLKAGFSALTHAQEIMGDD